MHELGYETPSRPNATSIRAAVIALLIGTVVWGAGFTWAKAAGEAVNVHAGRPFDAAFGPLVVLAIRFISGTALWVVIFPDSRRGWTLGGALRIAALGAGLCLGLVLQHLGLGSTSEAVSAFLTSLTIIFVPLIMTVGLRRPPPARVWIAVAMAAVGIFLLTGAFSGTIDRGVWLGLACAVTFSFEIIGVNIVIPREGPWRSTAGMFAVTGIICLFAALTQQGAAHTFSGAGAMELLHDRIVWLNVLLLTLLTTLLAFGLMNYFQPRLEPTHAALIYLMEPLFAAAFAYVTMGRTLGKIALVGGALILLANLLVELRAPETEDKIDALDPRINDEPRP